LAKVLFLFIDGIGLGPDAPSNSPHFPSSLWRRSSPDSARSNRPKIWANGWHRPTPTAIGISPMRWPGRPTRPSFPPSRPRTRAGPRLIGSAKL